MFHNKKVLISSIALLLSSTAPAALAAPLSAVPADVEVFGSVGLDSLFTEPSIDGFQEGFYEVFDSSGTAIDDGTFFDDAVDSGSDPASGEIELGGGLLMASTIAGSDMSEAPGVFMEMNLDAVNNGSEAYWLVFEYEYFLEVDADEFSGQQIDGAYSQAEIRLEATGDGLNVEELDVYGRSDTLEDPSVGAFGDEFAITRNGQDFFVDLPTAGDVVTLTGSETIIALLDVGSVLEISALSYMEALADFDAGYFGFAGASLTLTGISTVPTPATFALMLLGGGLMCRGRLRRKQSV